MQTPSLKLSIPLWANTLFNEVVYRQAAEQALDNWSIKVTNLDIASRSENVVYKVTNQNGERFALRIHRPGYNRLEELESEVVWAEALRKAGVYVPAHIETKDHQFYTRVELGDNKTPHQVGLIEWLDGDSLETLVSKASKEIIENSFFKLGELMGQVHNQTSNWTPPRGFTRRSWDADGLMGTQPLWGKFWETTELSNEQRRVLKSARSHVYKQLIELDQTKDNFGLIHADLHARNVLVQGDKLQIIDFDDCGYSWHSYEIAVAETDALSSLDPKVITIQEIRNALIEGYRSARLLNSQIVKELNTLTMVRTLILLGWANDRRELMGKEFFTSYIDHLMPAVDSYLKES